jgi:predicted Zn-ribbon and HTH transcriptional regulator
MKCKKCGFETTPIQIRRVGMCRSCENKEKKRKEAK